MWCFFDETWIEHTKIPDFKVGVFAGILTEEDFLPKLERLLYGVRRKYFGAENAKNPSYELRGSDLLSNNSFRLEQKYGYSRNLSIVREIISYLQSEDEHYIRFFASAVYGRNPRLLCPEPKNIPWPYRTLCLNISRAVAEYAPERRAVAIYDQRFQAETGIAIAMKAFIQGLGLPNLHPVPYFGVSHATPGLQVADILTHIVGKQWAKNRNFQLFYDQVKQLQWTKTEGVRTIYGVNTWYEADDGRYTRK